MAGRSSPGIKSHSRAGLQVGFELPIRAIKSYFLQWSVIEHSCRAESVTIRPSGKLRFARVSTSCGSVHAYYILLLKRVIQGQSLSAIQWLVLIQMPYVEQEALPFPQRGTPIPDAPAPAPAPALWLPAAVTEGDASDRHPVSVSNQPHPQALD